MNKSESWKTWLPLLGILVLFALVTAVWPTLSNALSLPSFGAGSNTKIPYEAEPIHLEGMKTVLTFLPDTISPTVAVLVVTSLTVVLVVAVGGGLSILSKIVYNIRSNTMDGKEYQEHAKALDLRGKEQLKRMKDGRSTDPIPSHKMPRWSIISNVLITLMFIGFTTMVLVRNFFPEGTRIVDGRIVNVTSPVFLVFAVIAFIIMGIRLRSQKLDALDETDFDAIPWDFIIVLITGLIMLGLGIGVMAYLNVPA
ncbi:MAG: hypothetical protein GY805_31430 [Chloroflexi bacterium]|nr:hypothetical protein [Chloroflexota bacterium]